MATLQLTKNGVVKNFPLRNAHINEHYIQFTKAGVGNYFVDLTTDTKIADTSVHFTKNGTVYYPRTIYIIDKHIDHIRDIRPDSGTTSTTILNANNVVKGRFYGTITATGVIFSRNEITMEVLKNGVVVWSKFLYYKSNTHRTDTVDSGVIDIGGGNYIVRYTSKVNHYNMDIDFNIDYSYYPS